MYIHLFHDYTQLDLTDELLELEFVGPSLFRVLVEEHDRFANAARLQIVRANLSKLK